MYHIKEEKVEMRENEKLQRLERHRMSMVQSSLSMAVRKLYLLLIQEPGLVSGMEEDVSSIHQEMLKCARLFGNFRGNVTESLQDIAYDVEDFIDYLTLKSSTKRSRGVLCKKLKKIKVKIHTFLHRPILKAAISNEIVEDQNIAQTVVSPVMKKVADFLAQGSLRPQVKKKVRRMEDEFKLINDFLENVETLEWDSSFMEWLEELCNVSCDAVGVINLFMINKRSLEGYIKGATFRRVTTALPKLRSQLRLGVEMDRISSRLKDASEKMPRQVVDHSESNRYRYNSSFGIWPERGSDEESDIGSFYDDVQEIMAQLLADEKSSFAISISGMKGIGKTTLAKLVFENEIMVRHFPYRVWASSDRPEIDFLKGILKQIDTNKSIPALWNEEDKSSSAGEEYKCMTQDEWEKIIRARQEKEEQEKEEFYSLFYSFLKDKKCLIVVDDIYGFRIINKLLTIFSDNNSGGSRMILILTDPSLISGLSKAGQGALHLTLQLRDDNESWAMFTHILKVTIPPQILISLRGDILKICCGLPLIIKRVADALSQKRPTMEEWSGVLQHFNGDQQFRSHILYDIDRCLPLHMRRCLFYFGLFPQNFDIPTRRLIALWIAEGLVYSEDETESSTLEDVARKYLTKLIGQCMVQVTKKKLNGEVQACRLPDPIRRQWYLKAKQATFLQLETSSTSSEISLDTGMIRRLVDHLDEADSSFTHIHGNHQLNASSSIPFKARYKATTSFISFDTRNGMSLPGDDIKSFLRRCISSNCFLFLRVLDLERVYKPNLPLVVGKLTLLRYLGLRWTSLEILPSSISKLLNLLTLDLKYTNIINLPSEIWKLQQLRHLYLSERDWSKFTHKPSAEGSLTALQTLWGLFIDEKTPVRHGLGGLLNLRKLALKFRLSAPSQQEAMVLQLEAVADWVLKLNHLQSLRLTSTDENNQPWDLDLKPLSNHGKLSTVYFLGRLKNPSVMSEFPNSLTLLTLSWSGLEEDPMQALDELPSLRVLRLLGRSYIGRRMLCSSGGFPQLRVLKLWCLEQLEEWNVEEGALRALRELEIRSCRLLRMFPQGLRHRAFLELKLTDMPDQFAAQD